MPERSLGLRPYQLIFYARENDDVDIQTQEHKLRFNIRKGQYIIFRGIVLRYYRGDNVDVWEVPLDYWVPDIERVEVIATTQVVSELLSSIDNKLKNDQDGDLIVTTRAIEGSAIDYTTTDVLSDVATLDISMFDEVTIMIKNTGANSADMEVYTKANSTGSIEYLEYSARLAPNDVVKVVLNGRYASAIVRAKSTTAGSPTTLRVEWIGGK